MSLLSRGGFGGIIKSAASGFATGGFTGAIAGGAMAAFGPGGGGKPPSSGLINMPFPVKGPGGQLLPGFGGTSSATSCPKGYHLNKHALAASHKHGAVPAHSMCVRNRSINPLNHRALTRSLKRLKRAGKLVRKLHGVGGQRRIGSGSTGGHKPGCGCFRCRKR